MCKTESLIKDIVFSNRKSSQPVKNTMTAISQAFLSNQKGTSSEPSKSGKWPQNIGVHLKTNTGLTASFPGQPE